MGKSSILVHNACAIIRLGLNGTREIPNILSGFGDDLEKLGIKTIGFDTNREAFFELAEKNGGALNNQWDAVRLAIENADGIFFTLKGLDPERFKRFVSSGFNDDTVPANGSFTNAELFTILTDETGDVLKKTTFVGGNVDDFIKLID